MGSAQARGGGAPQAPPSDARPLVALRLEQSEAPVLLPKRSRAESETRVSPATMTGF